jgi:transcriptional regulator with XRE-family HTH domain
VTDLFGSTIAKRRLARRLTSLRERNHFTANQVCDKLNWGRGKLGRFEANVWKRPSLSDIRDLARIYGLDAEGQAELEELAKLARRPVWWSDYRDVFGDSEYAGYEADAVGIRLYMPLILPGLLQTPAYTERVLAVGNRPAAWRQRALEARLRRQEILERSGGSVPELIAVITEASLLYRWGTPAERHAQLGHLIEMSRCPHIELRVLRLADGLHPGMSSMIRIFDFPGEEPSMAFLESDAGLEEVSTPEEVDAYVTIFGRIRDAALDGPATTALLKAMAAKLE